MDVGVCATHDASATARLDKSLHAEKPVMITYDRGARRLASSGYKYGAGRAPLVHPFLLLLFFFLANRRPHGPKEILGRVERKGPPGRA